MMMLTRVPLALVLVSTIIHSQELSITFDKHKDSWGRVEYTGNFSIALDGTEILRGAGRTTI